MKLKLELSQLPAKQNHDLKRLHQIPCNYFAKIPFIDTEHSTNFPQGQLTSHDMK